MLDLKRLQAVPDDDIPAAFEELARVEGEVEKTRAVLWQRLMAPKVAEPEQARPAEELLTPAEVADILRTNERWVRRHRHELGAIGERQMLRFKRSSIERWQRRKAA